MTRLDQLSATVIPFGRLKGKTFNMAKEPGDLAYLDWMLSIAKQGRFRDALSEYLHHPAIQPYVEREVERQRRSR